MLYHGGATPLWFCDIIPARLYQRGATPSWLCDIISARLYQRDATHPWLCDIIRLGYIREVLHLYGYVTLFG